MTTYLDITTGPIPAEAWGLQPRQTITCHVCDQPITGADYDDRLWWHQPDCPNVNANETGEWVDCECDIETHPGCMPGWAK